MVEDLDQVVQELMVADLDRVALEETLEVVADLDQVALVIVDLDLVDWEEMMEDLDQVV